jgi:DEAD/DEAH box helicase
MVLNAAAIRDLVSGPQEAFVDSAFAVLSGIAALSSHGAQTEARDLLLRVLDRRDELGVDGPLLDALIREHGLFPYLDHPEALGTADRLAYEVHRPLGIDHLVFHAKQAEAYRLLAEGRNVVLSAPTSFGKSLIIDGVIATGRYRTVVLIVPTVALIDETRRRLTRRFRGQYKIVTHPSQQPGERTVYVLTQERFLDIPIERFAGLGFFAVDEFYKLDALARDERSGLLNQAFHRLAGTGAQFYLLGPDVDELARSVGERLQFTFIRTDYGTVTHDTEFHPAGRHELKELVTARCAALDGPTILYTRSPARAREVARWLLDAGLGGGDRILDDAARWISASYHPQWLVARALRNGIGIHHGRMPRALAHHMVRLFNEGRLPWLVVTSTLVEGVNTIAKNMVIVDDQVGTRKLDFFTYSNICGRTGRMSRHFVGKVIVFGDAPRPESRTVDVPAFSQDRAAPLSLLVQLPWNELTAASRQRLQAIYQQQAISIGTIRAASGTDPEAIVEVARTLQEDPQGWAARLDWTGWPRTEQLQAACELIYHLSGGRPRGGVASGTQLAVRIGRLRQHKGDIRSLADEEMRFSGTDANEAVENVLDFIREWPSHHFPRLLMTLQSITEDVLTYRNGLAAGNYELFASFVERLFRPPMLTTLEEYGLPGPLSLKLGRFISLDATAGQVDTVLEQLRKMPRVVAGLSRFEEEMLRDTTDSL